jgi:hypothetical protein
MMFQALIGPIANLAGSWMESKVEQTKAKGAVAMAKAEAEAEVMKVAATHEAGWEKIMAQASDNSWKDEAWTILFIIIVHRCLHFTYMKNSLIYYSNGRRHLLTNW